MTIASPDVDALIARVPAVDPARERAAWARLDRLTKPPRSLGALEALAARLVAVIAEDLPGPRVPAILVFAGDHGVAARGVSAYPQAVTVQMLANFARGGAAINALARAVGARLVVADLGTLATGPLPTGIRDHRIARGTRDLASEPAMTVAQAELAIVTGARLAHEAIDDGATLLALGEMGIGNTTPAAALACALAGVPLELAVGPGTGLDPVGVAAKRDVVSQALARHRPTADEPLRALACVGGFEIAGLAGAMLAAAGRGVPAIVDGYIAGAAALVAQAMCPRVQSALVASHASREPGHRAVLAHLGLAPLLDLELRLGEASGAALAIPLVQAALAVYREMATFAEAGVSDRAP